MRPLARPLLLHARSAPRQAHSVLLRCEQVEGSPTVVKVGIKKEEAEERKKKLEAGAPSGLGCQRAVAPSGLGCQRAVAHGGAPCPLSASAPFWCSWCKGLSGVMPQLLSPSSCTATMSPPRSAAAAAAAQHSRTSGESAARGLAPTHARWCNSVTNAVSACQDQATLAVDERASTPVLFATAPSPNPQSARAGCHVSSSLARTSPAARCCAVAPQRRALGST